MSVSKMSFTVGGLAGARFVAWADVPVKRAPIKQARRVFGLTI